MTLYIIVFVVAFLILARSSGFLVHSLTGLARFFRISEYTVAFFFMSMATSMPELFVGLSSAITGVSEFSLGNILGANLINITLVIGLVIVMGKGLRVQSKISRRNFWIISGFAFLPLFLASDGVVSRGDGIVLLLAFAFYLLRLQREKEYFTKIINYNKHTGNHQSRHSPKQVLNHLSRFFWGVGLLVISSFLIVWAGKNLANNSVLSMFSFGMLFVALGTALPELAFGIRARMMKHGSMTIGNSLGSIALNSTLIVGLVSIINPIKITAPANLIVAAIFLFLALFFFNVFVFSKSYISRREGIILLAIYLLFLVFEYFQYFV